MSEGITDYILKENMPEFGFKIFIRNETSSTLFSKPELIALRELKDKGLVFEIPANILQKGHMLSLFFVPMETEMKTRFSNTGPVKEAAFSAMAKVEYFELCPEKKTVIADLLFTQYDTVLWKNILEQFSAKQEAITNILFSQHKVRDEE
jgi:hypothetical protein